MTTRYKIDPGQSQFTVHAVATGILSFVAHSPTFAVRAFSGELQIDGRQILELALLINAGTLALQDKVSASDRRDIEGRMRSEVLETTAYPEIRFQAARVRAESVARGRYQTFIEGQLSLHGVTRPHQVTGELLVYDDALRLQGRSSLRMSEYRIRPVTALGGMIKLQDELELSFDIVGFPEKP